MCGIVGFIDGERSSESAERLIDRMCQVIRHCGTGQPSGHYFAWNSGSRSIWISHPFLLSKKPSQGNEG